MMVEKIMVNTSLGAKGALAHGLQCLTVGLIQNGRRGLEIGQTYRIITEYSLSRSLLCLLAT